MTQQDKRPKENNPNTAQSQSERRGSGTQGQDARRTTSGQEAAKTTTQNTSGSEPNKSRNPRP